tara:strand:+ start:1781 stop:2155 length:375 start_codon:yes stop_codon:yes gene_type:complete
MAGKGKARAAAAEKMLNTTTTGYPEYGDHSDSNMWYTYGPDEGGYPKKDKAGKPIPLWEMGKRYDGKTDTVVPLSPMKPPPRGETASSWFQSAPSKKVPKAVSRPMTAMITRMPLAKTKKTNKK